MIVHSYVAPADLELVRGRSDRPWEVGPAASRPGSLSGAIGAGAGIRALRLILLIPCVFLGPARIPQAAIQAWSGSLPFHPAPGPVWDSLVRS